MHTEKKKSNFYYLVLALYSLLWLFFLTHFNLDLWLAVAIPTILTYFGLSAYAMVVHGKFGTSADFPAVPAAFFVLLIFSGIFTMLGWIEWNLEFTLTAIFRFGSAWFGSHVILFIVGLFGEKLGWIK